MTAGALAEGPFAGLVPGGYGLIMADPPWQFRTFSTKGEGKSPQAHYACMSLAEVKALPVLSLADPRGCALIMWATAPMLDQGVETLKAWGFRFKSAGAWAKQSRSGQRWAFGTGFLFRSAAEFYLLGTVGKVPPLNRRTRNLIVSPVREHSRKPPEMRRDAEGLFGGRRVELFARESSPGWDTWGNQATRFDPRLEEAAANDG